MDVSDAGPSRVSHVNRVVDSVSEVSRVMKSGCIIVFGFDIAMRVIGSISKHSLPGTCYGLSSFIQMTSAYSLKFKSNIAPASTGSQL